MKCLSLAATICVAIFMATGQQLTAEKERITSTSQQSRTQDQLRTNYVLGPDDQITIQVLDAEEISNKPVRITMTGNLRVPTIGTIKAAGLTVEQLEAEITSRLKQYIHDPEVVVSVAEFRSQPVSVFGAVRTPGVHQLQGRKDLIEILSLAGGLAEDAGYSVKITRDIQWGRIPLSNAQDDATGKFSVAEVSLKAMTDATNPAENITICPHDVISVPRAEMIYVTGQVHKPGGYVLRDRETLSVLKALSLAGGLDRTASPQNARILRPSSSHSNRNEIAVDLKKILIGKSDDVPLQAEDILFIPENVSKRAAVRAMEAALQIGTGVVIYRR